MADVIRKLVSRDDILQDLDTRITPKYFPDITLDKNRTSVYGWLAEAEAQAIEDTVVLEQQRGIDYCPELSNSEIKVNQTAKIRNVGVTRATPATAYAIIGVLKDDVITKGRRINNGAEYQMVLDRRSTILYGNVNFSLEYDVQINAVRRGTRYVYTAHYVTDGNATVNDAYLNTYNYEDEAGEEMVAMLVQIHQQRYNIMEKHVTDDVEFTYDGLYFDYNDKLADFRVFYKVTPTDEWKEAEMDHYLTLQSPTTKTLYYNDDESNVLVISNNPYVGLGVNSIIKVEIKETLGADGNIELNNFDEASFEMYQDSSYNYGGVYVFITMLHDAENGQDGDDIVSLRQRLIRAKTVRENITTEHDIKQYVNDELGNIQLVKKRNDFQDRMWAMYSIIRDEDKRICPTTTKQLKLRTFQSRTDPGDFDFRNITQRPAGRKVLKAYNRFELHKVPVTEDNFPDGDFVTKMDINTPEITVDGYYELLKLTTERVKTGDIVRVYYAINDGADGNDSKTYEVVDETKLGTMEAFEERFYLTCPYMIVVDDLDMCWYYFNTVNTSAILTMEADSSALPYRVITRQVDIFRDAHSSTEDDVYRFTIKGTLNTSTDDIMVEEVEGEYVITDPDKIHAFLFFTLNDTRQAYLRMNASAYDSDTREFTFTGTIRTSDYVTENDKLEIVEGLKALITGEEYTSVIDYSNASFGLTFMYKPDELDYPYYPRTESIYSVLPESETNGYVLMNSYYNNNNNRYSLLIDFTKFVRSNTFGYTDEEGVYRLDIDAVPFMEFDYGCSHLTELFDDYLKKSQVYGALLQQTTDFEVSLKPTCTYGPAHYLKAYGGRDSEGKEIEIEIESLNPILYFKVYGFGVMIDQVYRFIYEYLRDHFITDEDIFMSNICTALEDNFSNIKSVKFMGIDAYDGSYQHFVYNKPNFINRDIVNRYTPEQINITDIQIELDET